MHNGPHEPIHRLRINLEKRNRPDRLEQRVQSFERDANAKAPIEKRATPEVSPVGRLACSDEVPHRRSQPSSLITLFNPETQHPVEQVIPILAVRGVTSTRLSRIAGSSGEDGHKLLVLPNSAPTLPRLGSVRVALESLL